MWEPPHAAQWLESGMVKYKINSVCACVCTYVHVHMCSTEVDAGLHEPVAHQLTSAAWTDLQSTAL